LIGSIFRSANSRETTSLQARSQDFPSGGAGAKEVGRL